ncbi:MAG TPA: L(+)-tartrate dehydratase subunit alpha [Bacillota bacterium]|nr:L(+)-tartrate dehydratase subunit alpha [Bacillota bacterium]
MNDVKEKLVDLLAQFTRLSSIRLPDDVLRKLHELSGSETSERARFFYDAMLADLDMASSLMRPCCQDTGIIQYFVEAGSKSPYLDLLEDALRQAVVLATDRTPLRHNCVEVFDEKNTGDNTGTRIPWIDWQVIPDNQDLSIYIYLAGGGCSLPGASKVLMPLEGYEGVLRFVFDQVTSYGINACPPLLLGIGIAGSAEVAAKLSKKALLRPIGSANGNERGHALEVKIEEAVNAIGIGPGGTGGAKSLLGVHVEQAGRHPATLAVGLSTACWAHRRAHIIIHPDLSWEMPTHQGAQL